MIIGKSTLKISDTFLIAALQFYLEKNLFMEGGAPRVVSITPLTLTFIYGEKPYFAVELEAKEAQP